MGSLRDTEYDIKQRKGFALGAYNDLKYILRVREHLDQTHEQPH